MTTEITDARMSSDVTRHRAYRVATGNLWELTWLPGRLVSRGEAVTGMALAEAVAQMQDEGQAGVVVGHEHRLWSHIDNWAAQLGLTGPAAMTQVSETTPGGEA